MNPKYRFRCNANPNVCSDPCVIYVPKECEPEVKEGFSHCESFEVIIEQDGER